MRSTCLVLPRRIDKIFSGSRSLGIFPARVQRIQAIRQLKRWPNNHRLPHSVSCTSASLAAHSGPCTRHAPTYPSPPNGCQALGEGARGVWTHVPCGTRKSVSASSAVELNPQRGRSRARGAGRASPQRGEHKSSPNRQLGIPGSSLPYAP